MLNPQYLVDIVDTHAIFPAQDTQHKDETVKISNAGDAVVERDGLASDGAYGIIFNAKMAKILSDGLYSDKITSIIRELSCNAVDSHVDAGKRDVPIQVHLPTMFEPWFHVRDFGTGLDHQQVISIYTIYGASTKTNSNEFIGQLGLGSKSPFSYVDAYDVTAIKDGRERQYSMYKNEQGMPSVALLGEKPTTEANGVTVKMPVRQEDIRRFSEKAVNVFRWFAVRPEITGVAKLDIPELKAAFEGNGWRILKKENDYYNSERNRPVALMGKVAYPLDRNAINGLTKAQMALLDTPLVVDFAIGDLEIAASREALGYDERTQKSIRDRLAVVLDELARVFEQKMAGAATEWEARKIFGGIFGHDSGFCWEFERAFGNHGLKWKNLVIKEPHVTLKTTDLWDEKNERPGIYTNGARYKRARHQSYHTDITIRCSDRVKIIFDDLDKGGLSRINYLIETGPNSDEIYFIEGSDKKTRDEVLAILGNPPYQLASSLPKRPAASRTKVKMLEYRGAGTGTRAWKPVDVALEDGGIYVILDHWDVKGWGAEDATHVLERVVKLSKSLGILGKDAVVHAPRGDLKKKVQDSADWQDLWSLVQKEVTAKLTPAVLQMVADSNHFQEVSGKVYDHGLWKKSWQIACKDSPLGKFVLAMQHLAAISAKSVSNQEIIELAQIFGNTIKTVKPSVNAAELHRAVLESYPMLELVMKSHYYGSSSRFDDRKTFALVQDYINQCDRLREIDLAAEINTVVAA